MPQISNGVHRFTVPLPAGTVFFHLAKFFPYPIPRFESFRQRVLQSPLVSETQIGTSELGYPMYVWDISKPETMSRVGAPRIYIQGGIHPSETTSYFVEEGFLDWLLYSASPEASTLLDRAIVSIIPMCNPDGVALGNYRTNAKSQNLEDQYKPPYMPTVKESVAIISTIERFMGTPAAPGDHPIIVLLNLHSTHEVPYPFHFIHQPYYL